MASPLPKKHKVTIANSQTLAPIRIPQNLMALLLPHGCTRNEKSKTETMNGNLRRESETESSSSLETLLADHLLLIAYEEEEGLVTEKKNEITRKNGNEAAHEELMRFFRASHRCGDSCLA